MKNDTDNDAKTISINFATAAACNAVQAPITTNFFINNEGFGTSVGVIDNIMKVLAIHGMIAAPSHDASMDIATFTERELIFDNLTFSRINDAGIAVEGYRKINAHSHIYWVFDGEKSEASMWNRECAQTFRYVRTIMLNCLVI